MAYMYLTDFSFFSLSMMPDAFKLPNLVLYRVLPIFIMPIRWHFKCLEQMKFNKSAQVNQLSTSR